MTTCATLLPSSDADRSESMPYQSGYTILRIKRKREEDVPDVLVVEPSKKRGTKRRRAGLDVFQLAQTIDASELATMEQKKLRDRITELSNSPLDAPRIQQAPDVVPGTLSRRNSQMQPRQYRLVAKEDTERSKWPSRPSAPPKVVSVRDLAQANLKIYDAVLEPAEPTTDESDMEKFQDLLRDYLHLNESVSTQQPGEGSKLHKAHQLLALDDYVYDIFYRRITTQEELKTAMNTATVRGLPPGLGDDSEEEHESESEMEDEADEDSNAEDYYRNDYPENEDLSDDHCSYGSSVDDQSDEFHEWPEIGDYVGRIDE